MKVALITGASSGIGKAAALRLAKAGFHVFAGVRKPRDAQEWQSVPNAEPVQIDLTDADSVCSAISSLRGKLEMAAEVHLVSNAGIAVAGPVEGVRIERWKEQFDVNVFGLVRATQALLPFIRATSGRIVNLSSVSGLATSPYLGPYSASKFAAEAISDALRRELTPFGCKVIVVEPGPTATPIWEKNIGRKNVLLGELSPELRNVYGPELELMEREVQRTARNAAPVDRVASVIEKALRSPRPRTRYVVGSRGLGLQMALVSILPDRCLDSLLTREFRRS